MNRSDVRHLLISLSIFLPSFSLAETKIIWEKTFPSVSINEGEIKWELLGNNSGEDFLETEKLNNVKKKPTSFEELKEVLNLIQPESSDFINPLSIGTAFPTSKHLSESETSHLIYSLSSFGSGGAAGGSGNQNYAYLFDYGLNENTQLSAFYSVSDDTLYSYISGDKTIPNYWEVYGTSIKRKLFDLGKWSASGLLSLESWFIRNGDGVNGNIFDSREVGLSSRNLIGSLKVPISREINDKLDLHFLVGGSFLPKRIGDVSNQDNFYGNNLYLGSGLSWKAKQDLTYSGSIVMPFGPGDNSFNSEKYFNKVAIYNFGINYDLNPKIGIEGRITNSFGATPSTSILTIPSANKVLYFAGLSYKPFAIDSPQAKLSARQTQLSFSGLTVGSALIAPRPKSVYSVNIDSKGNLFGVISKSLSNSFQLDLVNFGSFNNQDTFSIDDNSFAETYISNGNYNTRLGGKFVLMSPLRKGSTWLSSRISLGRNQKNKQGYLFHEWINTYEINKKLSINLNPKMALSGLGSLYSFGISSNIHISDLYQLIPELNISLSKFSETNGSLSLRRVLGSNFYVDLYLSSAAGIQDLGQLLRSRELRKGIRINMLL